MVGRAAQVSAGELHSLFLLASGDAYSCGAGTAGELGTGGWTDCRVPRRVLLPEPARAVAAGGFHSLALSALPSRAPRGNQTHVAAPPTAVRHNRRANKCGSRAHRGTRVAAASRCLVQPPSKK